MSWQEFREELKPKVNKELALVVRFLRCEERNTWRRVSGRVFDFEEAKNILEYSEMQGHQPLGMYLCELSAEVLGENPEEDPWN